MDYRTPAYIQLQEIIRNKIASGVYPTGSIILSERELAATYGLNRMTVRNAVTRLVDEGVLKRVQGKGTFVIKPKITRDLIQGKGFSMTVKEKGVQPSSKILQTELRPATNKLMQLFHLDKPEMIFFYQSLHLANNEPVEIEEAYLPLRLVPNIEQFDLKVYPTDDILAQNEVAITRVSQKLRVIAHMDEAYMRTLKMPETQTAGFLLECTSYDSAGEPVKYTKGYSRGDLCRFFTILRKTDKTE